MFNPSKSHSITLNPNGWWLNLLNAMKNTIKSNTKSHQVPFNLMSNSLKPCEILVKSWWNPIKSVRTPQGIHLPHRPQQRTNAATSDVAAPQLLQQNCQKTATGHLSEAKIRWILPRKLSFCQKTKDFYLGKLFFLINQEILGIWQRNIWDLTGKND